MCPACQPPSKDGSLRCGQLPAPRSQELRVSARAKELEAALGVRRRTTKRQREQPGWVKELEAAMVLGGGSNRRGWRSLGWCQAESRSSQSLRAAAATEGG